MSSNPGSQWIWLSHVIGDFTPLYGGNSALQIEPDKSISSGDSCNTTILTLPSHAGTHVDSPYHFLATGKSVDQYVAKDWFFNSPFVTFFSARPGQLIIPEDIPLPEHLDEDTDLLLLCSGFENYRESDVYWKIGPGLAPELANYFVEHYPKLRAIGMDFISISSLEYRDTGRAAHRAFLEKNILLFEDMSMKLLRPDNRLEKVIAFPLRFAKSDGAPCTIVGEVVE